MRRHCEAVELFQKEENFQFEHIPGTEESFIRNLHPLPGEQSLYRTDESDPGHTTYGLLTELPNLDGTGHVLLIEGINMAGTEAAADFLLGESAAPLLSQAFNKHGDLLPFEVLVRTSNIGANAPRPTVISFRIEGR